MFIGHFAEQEATDGKPSPPSEGQEMAWGWGWGGGHFPEQEVTYREPAPPSADEEMALGTKPIASEIFDKPSIPYESLTDDHSAERSSGSDTNRSEPTQETEESGRSFDALEAASASRIHKRELEQARVNRRSRANKATKAGEPRTPEVDLSLVLGMERTLFAALNNSWLLALGGVGLMSVGNGDKRATLGGVVILGAGIISAMVAFIMHATRINQLANNRTSNYSHSFIWGLLVVFMTLSTLGLELYFGIMYPYLQREKEVTIVGGVDGL